MAEGDLGSAALGSVFKPSGKLTVLHNFMGSPDGSAPTAGLVLANDGNSYGVTTQGKLHQLPEGLRDNFSDDAGWEAKDSFDLTTGSLPKVTLIQHTNGAFYGDADEGSGSRACTVSWQH